ncbi:MAG: DUF1919 domain-containing protein [Muribaculaceae bacterium]|nr:DUF1919 domain-containing protein [Muribaculaceae bacterium]
MSIQKRVVLKLREIIGNLFFRKTVVKQMSKRLVNRDMTIITSNCIGCIFLHDMQLPFNTPTVNLFIKSGDFVKFAKLLDHYLSLDFSGFETSAEGYPIGILGDIKIYFVHYKHPEEAAAKWHQRKMRINKENMFFMMTDRDDCTMEMISELTSLPHSTVVFSHVPRPSNDSVVYIPTFEAEGCVGELYKFADYTGHRYYEKYFDIVKWLNTRK